MKCTMLTFLLVVAVAPILAGCFSGAEDKVYLVFKCAKVATLLGRETDADAALRNGQASLKNVDTGGSHARYAMQLGQRFQDDVQLYKYPLSSQLSILIELHGSRACQALYR